MAAATDLVAPYAFGAIVGPGPRLTYAGLVDSYEGLADHAASYIQGLYSWTGETKVAAQYEADGSVSVDWDGWFRFRTNKVRIRATLAGDGTYSFEVYALPTAQDPNPELLFSYVFPLKVRFPVIVAA